MHSSISLLSPALLFLAALGVGGCGGTKAEASAATIPVDSTITLGPRDVAVAVRAPLISGVAITGSLDPAETVEIKAQLSGQLDRVLVDRGRSVVRGQVLATYQSSALRTRTASAEAALASRERDLEAADTLYREGVFSERDHVLAKVARDAARADLEQSREALSFATVRAPISGEISERQVNSGEVVQPGARLFALVNTDALELAAQVGADQIGFVRAGQSVRLTLDAYAGRVLTGRVDRLEPTADPDTRRVAVYIRVPNAAPRIVGGLFARGTILTGGATPAEVITVPAVAITTDGSSSIVRVVKAERIERRVVTLGGRDDAAGVVEIRSGLEAGEHVIIAPGTALAPGARVRLPADSL